MFKQAYLVLLLFTYTGFFFFFNKLKVYGNLAWSKSVGTIFLPAFICSFRVSDTYWSFSSI